MTLPPGVRRGLSDEGPPMGLSPRERIAWTNRRIAEAKKGKR